MFLKSSRQLWKKTLTWTRVKLLYTRVTLTRITPFYFFLALVNCIVLVFLQSISYVDNSEGAGIIGSILSQANMTKGLPMVIDGILQICDNIPGQPGTICSIMSGPQAGTTTPISERDMNTALDPLCVQSLIWVEDILRDARREDLVSLGYQIWLFSLSMVTILHESIPHLGAVFVGHVLNAAWAGFRVQASKDVIHTYEKVIVSGPCDGLDILGKWWSIRAQHAVLPFVVNIVVLVATCYLSISLFKVYSTQSFNPVGASPQIHRLYKRVLCLSVNLQVSGFFSLASTAIWIDKISHGEIQSVNKHITIYLAAFIVTAVLEAPWLVLGWISVRRERRYLFLLFCAIGAILLAILTYMFFCPLYRFIFKSWPFFAAMTVTSYVLVVTTSVLGIVSRLHFGNGLAHYLQVQEALEDVDFTPVYFSRDPAKLLPADDVSSLYTDKAGFSQINSGHLPLGASTYRTRTVLKKNRYPQEPERTHQSLPSRGTRVCSASSKQQIVTVPAFPGLTRDFPSPSKGSSHRSKSDRLTRFTRSVDFACNARQLDHILPPISPVPDLDVDPIYQGGIPNHPYGFLDSSNPHGIPSSLPLTPIYPAATVLRTRRLGLPVSSRSGTASTNSTESQF